MNDYTDEQLAKQSAKGDRQALELLIQRSMKPVYYFVYRYVGTGPDAEDITQEIFVKVWKNLKKFNPKKNFKTWMLTIAKNTARDYFKKRKAIVFSEFENEEGENRFIDTLTDHSPLPSEILERKDIGRMLETALSALSPSYRTVLLLYYTENLNFREIAEMLNESINTAKSRHRRGLIQLKAILEKYRDAPK